ncbi:hypothetical protein Slin15195_G129530 [Septoria linicola]|uniref:Uncharacterized protein n=1 Tax=Septoria linicola TaxID=215465 RepID=A0A9Q9B270_9PEZI|nr:hypothetical protein Slin15195_G129530 [Septoria linicola]
MRQDRELATNNSTQSLRIRNLELEASKFLDDNWCIAVGNMSKLRNAGHEAAAIEAMLPANRDPASTTQPNEALWRCADGDSRPHSEHDDDSEDNDEAKTTKPPRYRSLICRLAKKQNGRHTDLFLVAQQPPGTGGICLGYCPIEYDSKSPPYQQRVNEGIDTELVPRFEDMQLA